MGKVYSQPACQLAYDGDVRRLSSAAALDPSVLDVRDDVTGDTPLIAACRRGKLCAVAFLLESHADVRARNKKGRTCLHYVAKQNFSLLEHLIILLLMPILLLGYFLLLQKQKRNEALMKEVLDSDVDVNAVDYVRRTPSTAHASTPAYDFVCVCTRAERQHGSSLRLSAETSSIGSSLAPPRRRPAPEEPGRRVAAGHRHEVKVQRGGQAAEEDAVTSNGLKWRHLWREAATANFSFHLLNIFFFQFCFLVTMRS
ncbi:ankyrin repeat domain-containing protein 22 isoform X1 [Festucalex cinctus]